VFGGDPRVVSPPSQIPSFWRDTFRYNLLSSALVLGVSNRFEYHLRSIPKRSWRPLVTQPSIGPLDASGSLRGYTRTAGFGTEKFL
jgi:hypothetical protein